MDIVLLFVGLNGEGRMIECLMEGGGLIVRLMQHGGSWEGVVFIVEGFVCFFT